jgi:hypothetical protein
VPLVYSPLPPEKQKRKCCWCCVAPRYKKKTPLEEPTKKEELKRKEGRREKRAKRLAIGTILPLRGIIRRRDIKKKRI